MKTRKNGKTMRAAGVLLVLVLVTACFVGGTFAKYVTSGGGTETARVAKFGVSVTASGDTFAKEYATDDQDVVAAIAKSVVSSDDKNVVAPGTKKDNALTVKLSGTPEVAVAVKYEAHMSLSDNLSENGNWLDKDGKFYCPLVVTVNGTKYSGTDYESGTEFIAAVNKAVTDLSKNCAPNTDLSTISSDLDISWEWPFAAEAGNTVQTDVKDTYLGDQSANGKAAMVGFQVVATVTQID